MGNLQKLCGMLDNQKGFGVTENLYLFTGSPYKVKIGGEPSERITERIMRHRDAVDVTHVGSECELSLKIPGKYCLSPWKQITAKLDENKKRKKKVKV